MPFWLRLLLGLGAGIATGLAFQPLAWWPLAFVGVGALTVLLDAKLRVWQTALLGLLFGLGLSGATLNWMNAIFTEAMVAIVVAVALFYVPVALLLKLSLRVTLWPLLAAGVWALQDSVICRWPFDGFGWVRLGYLMIDAPLAFGYPLIGVAGIGFTVALLGQCLALLVIRRTQWRMALAIGVVALTVVVSGGMVDVAQATGTTVKAGWVQGGAPGGGVYGLGEVRTITKNELGGTVKLAAAVSAGTLPQPDFVVWPENGTDLDPAHDAETASLVNQALNTAEVPMLLGIISNGPGQDERQTVSLWWQPGADAPSARYAKRGIVPFGEWVPYREVLEPLIPKLSYVGAQSVAGTEPGVLAVDLSEGRKLRLGVLVCYDVSFDSYAYDLTRNDADVLVVQSSNAMYQGTGQIDQQFAMTRIRAAELRREILVVTTSGVSGLIGPDGAVLQSVPVSAQEYGVVELPLRTGQTPVTYVSPVLEIVLAGGTVIGLLLAFCFGSRRRRGTMDAGV